MKTRWQTLLELVSLITISNAQGVQILGASDLELGQVSASLDLDAPSILSSSGEKEVLDFVNLLRLRW